MEYSMNLSYAAYAQFKFKLPEDKTWDDVHKYYIKWDQLFLFFKDNTSTVLNFSVSPELTTVWPDWMAVEDEGENIIAERGNVD